MGIRVKTFQIVNRSWKDPLSHLNAWGNWTEETKLTAGSTIMFNRENKSIYKKRTEKMTCQ